MARLSKCHLTGKANDNLLLIIYSIVGKEGKNYLSPAMVSCGGKNNSREKEWCIWGSQISNLLDSNTAAIIHYRLVVSLGAINPTEMCSRFYQNRCTKFAKPNSVYKVSLQILMRSFCTLVR